MVLPAVGRLLEGKDVRAAIGLALTMPGAAVVHLRRGERSRTPVNIVLIVLLTLVPAPRLGPVPL